MKITIITICLNSQETIRRTAQSVLSQKNVNCEYVIIDGGSSDKTIEIVNDLIVEYGSSRKIVFISERDKGIYDAMNKGVLLSTGEIIGIINSDDFLINDSVLSCVASVLDDPSIDGCYGDLLIGSLKKTQRVWISGLPRPAASGWMPPHPALFLKRKVYESFGLFSQSFGTSGDYEFMLRILDKIKITYIPKILVFMSSGGASGKNVRSRVKAFGHDVNAIRSNGIKNPYLIATFKKLQKIPQFLKAYTTHRLIKP